MVNETRYRAHMSSAIETKEVRADSHVWDTFISATTQPMTCNEHHALKDRFIAHKGLDVTGIGATACARHGCFCPSSVVNFVKGES